MLKSVKLRHLGPVRDLSAQFGERLNVLTGDNGLGKSFLLEIAFWSVTGSWPGDRVALPENPRSRERPTITYETSADRKPQLGSFDFRNQRWNRPQGYVPDQSPLVLYAGADGSFCVWDPARFNEPDGSKSQRHSPYKVAAYQFTPQAVASGLPEDDRMLCNGLIQDWKDWYYQRSSRKTPNPFKLLEEVVGVISHPEEPIKPGEPKRVFVHDTREFPTLDMPYDNVAFPHWAAGIRRVISLAYLLVWSWLEHKQATALQQLQPANELLFVIDEVEAHLHPKWQRTLLPALLKVIDALSAELQVQIIASTHSPLILASLEPQFDDGRDQLFWFDLRDRQVHFQPYTWAKHGDVVGWLTSPIFGLREARSREAEDVMTKAEEFMAKERSEGREYLNVRASIEQQMRRTLPGDDPIWSRWLLKTHGGLS
jgi:hypothetical protein